MGEGRGGSKTNSSSSSSIPSDSTLIISGIIDDVALIAWIYKSVDEDIQKFLEWEKSHKS